MTAYAITVQGLHCANCSRQVERHLAEAGAKSIFVDLANEQAHFELADATLVPSLLEELTALGFHSQLLNNSGANTIQLKYWTLFCIVLTVPLMLPMFVTIPIFEVPIVQLVLATPVFLFALSYFGKSAVNALRRRETNMDVLIAIGITSAFGYSLTGVLLSLGADYLFFETASAITTFVLVGNLIEKYSFSKTSSALRDLAALQEVNATRIIEIEQQGEHMEEILASDVQEGDLLLLKEGSRVPVDGIVTRGNFYADESLLTGESAPIEKQPAQQLVGGSLVIQGSGRMQATATGANSTVARIISLVRNAQNSRPDIQQLGDRVSAIFVPIVLALSLLTFLASLFVFDVDFQDSLLRAIAVLVISCPCAMGLATPTAVSVALGRAAKLGILFKTSEAIQHLSQVTAVLFDKTGTLTTGDFNVLISIDDENIRDEVIGALFVLEQHSVHPIARSIVRKLAGKTSPLDFHSIEEKKGLGIQGTTVDGVCYAIGSSRLLPEGAPLLDTADLYILRNDTVVGTVELTDTLRPNAKVSTQELQNDGLLVLLLSGDSEKKVKAVATELSADGYWAAQSPEEKLERIERRAKSEHFAYVGDGINDAPALARAPISIALSDASQIAIESASVVITAGSLDRVPVSIALSKQTLRIIKQNLFWAFFYNVLAIPLAACGLLTPMVAALTMACSDVVVIGNSLRLKSIKLH